MSSADVNKAVWDMARAALGEPAFAAAWAAGQAMPLAQAIDYALQENGDG